MSNIKKCPTCGELCANQGILNDHIYISHNGPRSYDTIRPRAAPRPKEQPDGAFLANAGEPPEDFDPYYW